MFESVRKLVFNGAAFTEKTSLPLFASDKHRLCLIYGKNGSGKSTISKALLKIAGAELPEITSASLEDSAGKSITYSPGDNTRGIFVFNEDYVQSKVRLKEDGLGTIVMFGKQAELESLIEAAQKELDAATAECDKVATKAVPFDDLNSVSSPSYYISKMNLALSGDKNWSGRDRLIMGNRRNTSVTNMTYETIMHVKPKKSAEDTIEEYQRQYALLCAARAGDAKISVVVNTKIAISDIEERVRELLAQRIEKPELSERETYLMTLLSEGKTQEIENIQKTFSDPATAVCPFCFRPVETEYKDSLVQSIKKVLSKVVDDHKVALRSMKVQPIEMDLSAYQKLDGSILEKCQTALTALNTTLNSMNTALDAKFGNPYTPIMLDPMNLKDKIANLSSALEDLEKARVEYNESLSNIPNLQKALQTLNSARAYYEIEELYTTYLKQKNAKAKVDAELGQKRVAEEKKRKALEDLQLQRRSIKIAIDMINSRLRYVFFSANRLEIEPDESGTMYTLKSNGKSVRPSDISVGERNILALCYFFVEMLDNTDAEKAFSQESLVVIDDPVSSFDHENRIGIMSLLRRDLEKVIEGNNYSRLVLLTHDLQAAFDIQKAFDEISSIVKQKTFGADKCNSGIYELKDRNLSDFRYKKRHEYSELLAKVYRFGVSPSLETDATIGNTMRRTLEAFSTFVYKKGIDEISISEDVLASIEKEQYVEYFRHLMYRLVLNGESHSEERVRTLVDDNDFLEMLSTNEKQRTAKDIMCFIYLLNPAHVRAHLNSVDVQNYETTISGWCNDILSFTSGSQTTPVR